MSNYTDEDMKKVSCTMLWVGMFYGVVMSTIVAVAVYFAFPDFVDHTCLRIMDRF